MNVYDTIKEYQEYLQIANSTLAKIEDRKSESYKYLESHINKINKDYRNLVINMPPKPYTFVEDFTLPAGEIRLLEDNVISSKSIYTIFFKINNSFDDAVGECIKFAIKKMHNEIDKKK